MTLKFDNVHTATYAKGEFSFGDLQDMGLLRKGHRRGWDPECDDIVWYVGDVEFTDSHGNHWKPGDEIVWER